MTRFEAGPSLRQGVAFASPGHASGPVEKFATGGREAERRIFVAFKHNRALVSNFD